MNFIPKIEYVDILDGTPKTVLFDSPPEGDPFKESFRASSTVSKSNNGTKQTQFNYVEQIYALEFIFQSETTKQAIQDFYLRHALRGGEFNYFPSSDEVEFETYTLVGKGVKFGRPIPSATPGEFEYDFSLSMERVVNVL